MDSDGRGGIFHRGWLPRTGHSFPRTGEFSTLTFPSSVPGRQWGSALTLCSVSLCPAQEIDGKSLLLMQRTDVLTGLSIRLGPALKIYEHHIKVLQQGHFEDDDPDGLLG